MNILIPYAERAALLHALMERTKDKTLQWHQTAKDIRCESAGVLFIIKEEKDSGNNKVEALSIWDGEIILFRETSNLSSDVYVLRNLAITSIQQHAYGRVKQIFSCLKMDNISDTEVTRGE
jgi:hypothetical protein